MHKKSFTLKDFVSTNPSLYQVAGISVMPNGMLEVAMLDKNQKAKMANKALEIFKTAPTITCIKEIQVSSSGIMVKIEGKLNEHTVQTVIALGEMTKSQKHTATFFPAITNGSTQTMHICDNKHYSFKTLGRNILDAKIENEVVHYYSSTKKNELRNVPFVCMTKNDDWEDYSQKTMSLNFDIRGMGRLSIKNRTLPITTVSGQILQINLKTKSVVQLDMMAKNNQVYLGIMKLVDCARETFFCKDYLTFGMPALATSHSAR